MTGRWGGYALARPPAVAGPATLARDGVPVATVHLNPDGGHHRYEFTDPAAADYLRFADQIAPNALEPDDVLTDQLLVVDDLNRSTAVIFTLDEGEFFATGAFRTYGPDVPFDDVVAMLTGAHRPGGDVIPLVWVKDRSQFVPVTELRQRAGAVA